MVKIVWDTWTLKELKEKLHIDNLKDFLIMSEKLKSQKDELILKWQEECKHELCELKRDIALFKKELEHTLYNENQEGFFQKMKTMLVVYNKWRKIGQLQNQLKKIEGHFEEYSMKNVEREIWNILYEEHLLESLKSVYYWAIWEEAVVEEFKHMYSPWILINNFNQHFDKPIFTKWGHDRIMSIQIDHIFINDKGIFLIETKNRSNRSKESFKFSPIQQVERSGHAFYFYLKWLFNKDRFFNNCKFPTIYKIVVFVGGDKIQTTNNFISVLYIRELKRYIETKMAKLTPSQYNHLWEVLIEGNEV
jgi:hypothetical protein